MVCVRLHIWDSKGVYFVLRHKDNIQFKTIKENEQPENRHENILIDEIIELTGKTSKMKYPKKLRRVAIWNDENKQVIPILY